MAKKNEVAVVVEQLVYNPVKDIQKVEPFGFVDIVKANQTSSVPAGLQVDETRFNCIEDPRSISTRPRDEFEAMQANKVIVAYKPEGSAEKTE